MVDVLYLIMISHPILSTVHSAYPSQSEEDYQALGGHTIEAPVGEERETRQKACAGLSSTYIGKEYTHTL